MEDYEYDELLESGDFDALEDSLFDDDYFVGEYDPYIEGDMDDLREFDDYDG